MGTLSLRSPRPFLAAALLLSLAIPAHAAPPVYLRTLGAGQLGLVGGVAIGSDGDLFVLDQEPARVHRFHPDGTAVADWDPVAGMGSPATPYGLEADGAGKLYVTVAGSPGHLRVFDEAGTLQADVTGDGYGNTLVDPWGMTVRGFDLYLADPSSGLWKYTGGTLSRLANAPGCGPGQVHGATGLAAVGTELYQTEYSDRLQRLDANGGFLAELGSTAGCGDIRGYPRFVTRFGSSAVLTVDMLTDVLRIVSTSGAVLESWGGPGSGHGQFSGVMDAVVSADGTIYVADGWNHRVEVYGSGPTAAAGASWGAVKIRYR